MPRYRIDDEYSGNDDHGVGDVVERGPQHGGGKPRRDRPAWAAQYSQRQALDDLERGPGGNERRNVQVLDQDGRPTRPTTHPTATATMLHRTIDPTELCIVVATIDTDKAYDNSDREVDTAAYEHHCLSGCRQYQGQG